MNKILLTIILLTLGQVSFGQSINKLELNNKQSILKDRVYLTFPDSAKNLARPVDIMSHDPNAEKETRIVFDNGSERLVFFAQELFVLANKNLFGTLKSENAENFEFEYSEIKSSSKIIAIQSIPTKWDDTKGGILINSLTVMTEDSSLIRIDAYINPDAYKEQKDNYVELTKNVFNTIKNGTRLNNLEARTETHKIFGTDRAFVFKLPKNSIIQIDQKYDFQVFRIKTYSRLGDSSWRSVSIYTGHHPSYSHPDYGFEGYTDKQKTKFLNKSDDWLYFENKEKELYLKEQKIESNNIEKGLIVHIALSGNSSEIIDELTELIETIELK
jgi:hypothetical protein